MKTKLTPLTILIFTLILLYSCSAPRNIIKLEPETESVKWLFGQSFAVDSLYGIIYEVGFDRLVGDEYWFDFHITNRSNLPILIDPVDFAYEAYDSLMNTQTSEPIKAINPEDEILSIDKELSHNEAREKNHLGLSLFAAGVDIATGVATLSDDNPNNDHWRTHLFADTQAGAIENDMETQNLNVLRDEWSSTTIRKTTLESNYSMHGKVFFKAITSAAFIKLLLPVDDRTIEMSFKQTQHRPN
nr:hypothetical protein [Sunxiuqinia sp.]